MGELLAIISALFFGLGSLMARKGSESMPTDQGVMVSLLANAAALAPFALILVAGADREPIPVQGVALFALTGVLGPFLGRMSTVGSIMRLGPSRATIYKSLQPIITTGIALTLLNESFTPGALIGGGLMMIGIWYVTSEPPNTAAARPWDAPPAVRFLGISLGVASAFFFSMTNLVRKMAMTVWPAAIPGALVGVLVAMVVMAFWPGSSNRLKALRPPLHRGHLYFALLGVFSAGAQVMFLSSLTHSPVWVANLITSTEPMVVIIISFLLFRGRERLNRYVLAGAALTVVGMVLLILMR